MRSSLIRFFFSRYLSKFVKLRLKASSELNHLAGVGRSMRDINVTSVRKDLFGLRSFLGASLSLQDMLMTRLRKSFYS